MTRGGGRWKVAEDLHSCSEIQPHKSGEETRLWHEDWLDGGNLDSMQMNHLKRVYRGLKVPSVVPRSKVDRGSQLREGGVDSGVDLRCVHVHGPGYTGIE